MASFEEKLIALSDAETLKKAKNLLKSKTLSGAWRNADGHLCGIFRESGLPEAETEVVTGDNAAARCSCSTPGKFCAHALALMMYSGRFHLAEELPETPPVYSKGLILQSFEQLSARGMKNCAKLRLNVVDDQLHAPNQYKILLLQARLFGASREYAGNLNNLKQLYFEKSLSVVLKYEDFSLHDQQIIRFLALNGTAENSNIALGAELTAELFHALPGFPRFFRNGSRITIRPERAEAVLAKVNGELLPGIRFDQAVLPMPQARLIAGRGGSWVGKNDEFFFIGGNCEAGFLRSFFRMTARNNRELKEFPLPVAEAGSVVPELQEVSMLLDGGYSPDGGFVLKTGYLYSAGGRTIIAPPRSGRTGSDGRKCFHRELKKERAWENALAFFGMDVDDADASAGLDSVEKTGIFLDRALPEIIRQSQRDVVFSRELAALCNGGNGLPELPFECRFAGKSAEGYILDYTLGTPGSPVAWETLFDLCCSRGSFIMHRGKLWKIPAALGRFMRSSPALLSDLDTAGCRFEVLYGSFASYCTIAGRVPGAVPVEMLLDHSQTPEVPLTENFRFEGELRSYQKQGVAFMQYLTDRNLNPLLADEMGLGKTVQLLALLSSRLKKGGSPALIVCPASLIVNWAREAGRFVPDLKVAVPTGSDREKVLKDGGFDLLILSYTAAKLCQSSLKKYFFSFLVLDEAQHIKNPGSTNAKNCKSIRASHRIVLTGTPLENSPEDLWSVMDFLQPGLLGTLPAFRRRYVNIANDPELQDEFTARIAPFIKRRTKDEVAADLPEKHESIIFCEMPPGQRKIYDDLRFAGRHLLSSGGNAELFALLLRLRQCCCHPALLPEAAAGEMASGKSDLLFELLNETIDSGHKVLLFSQFTSMLKLLIPQLQQAGIPFEYLDGATRDRQQRVDRFNQNPDIPLFLLSLKAGGTGLNLTAADTVIIYDPWWNPAVELQAADRTHRIGQTRTVSTIKLVMKDSVEEKVLLLQQKKRDLFQMLVENPAASGGIPMAELRALIE